MLFGRAIPRTEVVRNERKSLAESKWVKLNRREEKTLRMSDSAHRLAVRWITLQQTATGRRGSTSTSHSKG